MSAEGTHHSPVGNHTATSDWSRTLGDQFIKCRDMGHLWRPFRATLTETGTYWRVLRCGRCNTTRTQELSARGETLSSAYAYPEGYQAPPGSGRMDGDARNDIRLESTRRLIDPKGNR